MKKTHIMLNGGQLMKLLILLTFGDVKYVVVENGINKDSSMKETVLHIMVMNVLQIGGKIMMMHLHVNSGLHGLVQDVIMKKKMMYQNLL